MWACAAYSRCRLLSRLLGLEGAGGRSCTVPCGFIASFTSLSQDTYIRTVSSTPHSHAASSLAASRGEANSQKVCRCMVSSQPMRSDL